MLSLIIIGELNPTTDLIHVEDTCRGKDRNRNRSRYQTRDTKLADDDSISIFTQVSHGITFDPPRLFEHFLNRFLF